jgi:SAM-dependent methyltransferase
VTPRLRISSGSAGFGAVGPSARRLFGTDPGRYAVGRPGYPAGIFDALAHRCGLAPGTPTLEIGPGTGQATADLLARGAEPLTVVEPDPALAAYLRRRFGSRITIAVVPFEEIDLAPGSVRLAASATAWHWVDQDVGLRLIRRVLAPGGWWACWWTLFHDPDDPDDLFEALEPILEPLSTLPGQSRRDRAGAFAFDREARAANLARTGSFDAPEVEVFRWKLELDARRARMLFATFSPILALAPADRESVLDRIVDVVDGQFGGHVIRSCVSILYTARRR